MGIPMYTYKIVPAVLIGLLRVAFVIMLTASCLFIPILHSQVLTDEVHITPRSGEHSDNATKEPSLISNNKSIKVNVNLVLVPVTITDVLNRTVVGLEKSNFMVFDGNAAQEIRHFSSEDAPISLGVIFDTSGSMRDKFDRARQAIVEFFKTANPQDEFFMIAFSDTPEELSDFTNSVEDIQDRLLFVMPKGRTALLDAIYLGVRKMKQAKYQRKALLIISDGGDNRSRYSEGEIISRVKEADVQMYAIGIFDPYFRSEEESRGPGLLANIAEITGGREFTVDDPNELGDVAAKISIELRNQYIIGYRPQSDVHNGKWHKVKVKLVPPKGLPPLQVHAKTGYYAPSG
jgi:Ca-activated chloride channel family protein